MTTNVRLDLQAWPLVEEKVHMWGIQAGVIATMPWPLPQSIETEVEPGIVTAIHQALVPV